MNFETSNLIQIDRSAVCEDCEQLIGLKVQKRSGKPFKSGQKIGTIKGVVKHPTLGHPSFTFEEDTSYVECWRCEVYKKDSTNE